MLPRTPQETELLETFHAERQRAIEAVRRMPRWRAEVLPWIRGRASEIMLEELARGGRMWLLLAKEQIGFIAVLDRSVGSADWHAALQVECTAELALRAGAHLGLAEAA